MRVNMPHQEEPGSPTSVGPTEESDQQMVRVVDYELGEVGMSIKAARLACFQHGTVGGIVLLDSGNLTGCR